MKGVLSFLISLIVVTVSVGCSQSQARKAMDRAESVMESRPDSALSVLDSIDSNVLKSKEEKARYALLKSMALDKNYIDKTDFDVLQPAIDYYLRKGTPDERLKTYYYQGRIYQNQGDRDKTFGAFARGLDIAEYCKDSLLIARTLIAQGCIYQDLYDFEKLVDICLKAARLSKKIGQKDYEFHSLLYCLNGATLSKDKETADSVNQLLTQFASIDDNQRKMLYMYRLPYMSTFCKDTLEIQSFINSAPDGLSLDQDGSLALAGAYLNVGDNLKGEGILKNIYDVGIPFDTLKYLALKIELLRNQRNYAEEISTYRQFNHKLGLKQHQIFAFKSRALEDKYLLDIANMKSSNKKSTVILWCAVALLLFSLGFAIMFFVMQQIRAKKRIAEQQAKTIRAENENLIHRIAIMEEEQNHLSELLDCSNELPEEIREIVSKRINMLNSLLSGEVASIKVLSVPFEEWAAELKSDKQKFLNENRMGYMVLNPKFIRYLENRNLTGDEINYVCLYLLGMNGSEISEFLKMPSFKNKTKDIRRKLGLGIHDTNLKTYIVNLFQSV